MEEVLCIIPGVSQIKGDTGEQGPQGDTGETGATGPAPAGQIFLSAAGMWPSTTSGCANNALSETSSNDLNYYTLDFDKDSDEHAECTIAMPSDWDAGTVTAKFYWTTSAGSSGETIQWAIKGVSLGNDDAMDSSFGTAQSVSDTWIANEDLHITSETSAITVTGAGASEIVQFKVYRDVSEDTLNGDAKLIGVMITFTRN